MNTGNIMARIGVWIIAALGVLLSVGTATAAQPVPWQMDLQPAATSHMQAIIDFHWMLVIIITAISVFVLALLLWIMVRYNASANPVPAKFSHNTLIEVVWTVVPIIILIVIAIPSIRVLYDGDVIPKADMTIKVSGLPSWGWTYTYPDHGDFSFNSFMVRDKDGKPAGEPRLLAVDNQMVVPVGKVVRMLVTSQPGGIIHAWAVPAFGVKTDAVPGRMNETWFKAERTGTFYGQCSELCGVNHAYMPIAVKVVSDDEFKAWTDEAKKQFGSNDDNSAKVAQR